MAEQVVPPDTAVGALQSAPQPSSLDASELEDRRRVLRFDALVTELSGAFGHLAPAKIDAEIERALRLAGESLGVDRCAVFRRSDDASDFRPVHAWEADGLDVPRPSPPGVEIAWATDSVLRGEITRLSTPADFPGAGPHERDWDLRTGLKAALIVPLQAGETVLGALAICCFRSERTWPDDLLQRVRLFADVLANALMRQTGEERLLAEQTFSESVVESMPGFFFMIDDRGRYVRWNKKVELLTGYPSSDMPNVTVGLRVRPEDQPRIAEAVAEGFRTGQATLEYAFLTQDGHEVPYYANARSVSIGGTKYLVCMAIDISARKQAERALLEAFSEIKQLKEQLRAECTYLQEEITLEHDFENIIGHSDPMKYVLFKIEQVAPTDVTVLIQGETGTGKELVARAIHGASARNSRPLVKVDCASLPPNLIESELFGHEKGAFTSAHGRRTGRFELANGGTIFLDEVGELPLTLQSKLLRVIEEGEFERVGSSRTIKVDARIIAATNRQLEEEVRAKTFREDLWYRLNVFPISVPPLRERADDIPLLVNFFVAKFGKKLGKSIRIVPVDVMDSLRRYPWRGNVRELEHVIERAVICTQGSVLHLADRLEAPACAPPGGSAATKLVDLEREHIVETLRRHGWRIEGTDGAAAVLGLNPSTLRGRMRKLGIRRS